MWFITLYSPVNCPGNPSQSLVHGCYKDSTKNLLEHAQKCNPTDTPELQQITAFVNGTTYSPARFRFLLAMWCACRHQPFNIVGDKELQEILQMLYSCVDIPHPITVSCDVKEIFCLCKQNVAKFLQVLFLVVTVSILC